MQDQPYSSSTGATKNSYKRCRPPVDVPGQCAGEPDVSRRARTLRPSCRRSNGIVLCQQWASLGFEVRSCIPGRLRLRVPAGLWSEYLARLHRLVPQALVGSLEPKCITASVLLRYDDKGYTPQQFLARLQTEAQQLVSAHEAPAPPVSVMPQAPPGWTVKSDLAGRLRAVHPWLCNYAAVARQ